MVSQTLWALITHCKQVETLLKNQKKAVDRIQNILKCVHKFYQR